MRDSRRITRRDPRGHRLRCRGRGAHDVHDVSTLQQRSDVAEHARRRLGLGSQSDAAVTSLNLHVRIRGQIERVHSHLLIGAEGVDIVIRADEASTMDRGLVVEDLGEGVVFVG